MSMNFACPKCQQVVMASPEWAGRMVRCPGCGQPIQVPAAAPGATGVGTAPQSVVKPCPRCSTPLKLTAQFQGRRIRCTACQATLAVAAGSWGLTVVEGLAAGGPGLGQQGPSPQPSPPTPSPGSFQSDLFAELPPVGQGQGGLDPFAAAQGTPLGGPLAGASPLPGLRRSRSTKPLLVAGMIAGGVLSLALVIGLIAMLASSVGGLGGGAASANLFLPDNSKMVGIVDVRGLMASKPLQAAMSGNAEFQKAQEEMKRATGLTLDDVVRVTVGGDPSSRGEHFVAVVELRRAIDKDSTLKSLPKPPTEEKIGDAVLYAGLEGGDEVGLHFANDRTVVVGSVGELRTALQRQRKAQFPDALQKAVDRLDRSQTLSFAIVNPGSVGAAGPMPFDAEMLSGIEAVVINAKATSDLRLAAVLMCKEDKVAEDLKKMVDGFLAMASQQMAKAPPEVKDMVDSLKVSRSGRDLHAQITLTEKVMSAISEAGSRRRPGGVRPPGLPF